MFAYFVHSKSEGNIAMFTSQKDALAYASEWLDHHVTDTLTVSLERRW